jgi:hypothetical protein
MTVFFSASLFDRLGTTLKAHLINSIEKQFVDELYGEGSFSLQMIKEEAVNLIEINDIVKFSYGTDSNDYVFAGVVESIKRNYTDDQDVWEISGRGVRSLLEHAVIYTNDREYTDKTVGYIFKELFDEAQTRGALDGLTITFNNTTDSNGQSFTSNETITIDEKIGTSLAEIANKHQEMAVDIRVLPDLSINYYKTIGTDRTTGTNPLVLRVGQNVLSYDSHIEGPIKNASPVIWGDNFYGESEYSNIAEKGRYETFLSITNINDADTRDNFLFRLFDKEIGTEREGATIELTEDFFKPYIDYFIGDKIIIADDQGNRKSYTITSLSLSEQDDGSIRIVPEIGDKKPKFIDRLKRIFEREESKTFSGSADNTAASIDLNGFGAAEGGGLSELFDGTVVSFDNLLGTGLATVNDIDPINDIAFTNATGEFLAQNDEILVIVRTDNNPATPDEYIAIGITSRAGATTPVNQPVGTLNPNFPLRTDNLPNGFRSTWGQQQRIATDFNGYLGFGLDTIIGPDYNTTPTSISGFSRELESSFSIGTPPGGVSSDYVIFSDGRLFTFDSNGMYERNPSTGVWTTHNFGGVGLKQVTTDYSNGWIWIYTAGATATAGGPFWSYSVNDASPVARGALGTALTNGTNDTTVRIAADNGKLVLQFNDAEPTGNRFHMKNSNDGNNFAYTHITTNFIVGQSGADNERLLQVPVTDGFYYITTYTASTPDEAQINFFDNTNGSITTYLTGIANETSPLIIRGYHISTSGLHVFTGARNNGGADNIFLATNNLTSTNYVYTYTATDINASDIVGQPVEVEPNVYYFGAYDNPSGAGALNASYAFGVTLT